MDPNLITFVAGLAIGILATAGCHWWIADSQSDSFTPLLDRQAKSIDLLQAQILLLHKDLDLIHQLTESRTAVVQLKAELQELKHPQ